MFRQAWGVRDGAYRESRWLVQHIQRAFVARSHSRDNYTSLSLETLAELMRLLQNAEDA